MSNIRLTVVIRKDLQLADGQIAAQAAHVSDNWMRKKIVKNFPTGTYNPNKQLVDIFSNEEVSWMMNPYISILAVNTKEEMDIIYDSAKEKGLQVYDWSDILPSKVLNGRFVKYERIGISIGPEDMDKIKEVTGTLPLF